MTNARAGWVGAGLVVALTAACQPATPDGGTSSASSTSSSAASAASSTGGATGAGATSGGTSSGGGTGATLLDCDAGLKGLTLTGAENDELAASCVIDGDLVLGGSASLKVDPNVVLVVVGNIALSGTASLGIDTGALGIGNQSSFEYALSVTDNATLNLKNSELVTNPGGVDNLTSVLTASGNAKVVFDTVAIDSAHNWLLANMAGQSTLTCTDAMTPNETYLGDQCAVSISGTGTDQGLWLRLTDGTLGTLALPNTTAPFTWSAGHATGLDVGWNLTVTNAQPGVGIESHAGSSWTVIGADAGVKDTTIGLFLDPPTAPGAAVTLSDLPIGVVGATTPFTVSFPWDTGGDTGGGAQPQLTLEDVNLGPIAWQIYVGSDAESGPVPVDVTISDSVVNEIGVTAGTLDVVNGTLQLAVLAALADGAVIHATGDDIWSQTILASGGGMVAVDSSNIHGSLLQASTGGQITVSDSCILWANGDSPTCDEGTAYLHMEASGGIPICNPFTTPMQLPALNAADSTSTITMAGPANPACLALDAGSYTPALLIEQGGNPTLGSGQMGTVSCAQTGAAAVVVEARFEAYPDALDRDATSGDLLVPDAGYTCTVTAGAASHQFDTVAPGCG